MKKLILIILCICMFSVCYSMDNVYYNHELYQRRQETPKWCKTAGYVGAGLLMLGGAGMFFDSCDEESYDKTWLGLGTVVLGMFFMAHIEYRW